MRDARLIRTSRAAAIWAAGYATYRLYYAAGGEAGMFGTPLSYSHWRLINAVAGGALLVASLIPLIYANTWREGRARLLLLSLSWIVAVGCIMHALVGISMRILSLRGMLTIDYPFWASIDRRQADLQALFFNEPWFLIEGVIWAAMAWSGALHASPRRWWWVASAAIAIAALSVVALLSAFGIVGRAIIF